MLASRLKATADELPELRARIAQLRATAGANKVTLDGSNDAITAANQQTHIEELAASVGVTIGSTESLPVETRGRLPPDRPAGLIAKLEAATPPLVIDTLHIHGVLRRPGTPAAGALDAGLDVFGFRNNDNTAAAKP